MRDTLDEVFMKATAVFNKYALDANTPRLIAPKARTRVSISFGSTVATEIVISNDSTQSNAGFPVWVYNPLLCFSQKNHGDYATNEFWAVCSVAANIIVVETFAECPCGTGHPLHQG